MKKFKKISMVLAAVMIMTLGTSVFAAEYMEYLDINPDIATACLNGSWNSSATYGKATAQTYYEYDYPIEDNYNLAVRLERFETNSNKYSEYKYDKDKINANVKLSYAKTYCFKSRHSVDNPRTNKEIIHTTFADYDN